MPEIFSSTLPRSSNKLCSCLIGSKSSTTQLAKYAITDLFSAAGRRSKGDFAVIGQAHRFGGNQFQNVGPAKTPAPANAIAGNNASFSKLIHGFEVYF